MPNSGGEIVGVEMHIITAFDRRESLSIDDLVRLRTALADEVERYRFSIRGYDPEKMRQFGAPFLAKLEARVSDVDRILLERGS